MTFMPLMLMGLGGVLAKAAIGLFGKGSMVFIGSACNTSHKSNG